MENDHLTVLVRDYSVSKPFYEEVLARLGLVTLLDWPDNRRAYFGKPGEPSSLWLVESGLAAGQRIALEAEDAGAVHAFYGTAVAAGARSDREPKDRSEHYSARVLDFDGNALEVVFRGETAALHVTAAA
jgi:catechol 2,3-dioxygenase-like lactoylglutathione lyase family enzyme